MALIKYVGSENVVVTINGERKLIKPNKIFSGPESYRKHDNFIVLGYSREEKEEKDKKKKSLMSRGIKLEIKDFHKAFVDFDLLEEFELPKISICIVSKDSNGIIQKCVDSIFKHTKYPSFEVLICDTGTTNKKVLKSYQEWTDKYGVKKMKIFTGKEYNFSKNNNFLALESTGDILLLMNNDVYLTYDAISYMVKYALCSNIGCLGHRLVWERSPREIQHDGQIIYKPTGEWYGPGHHNYHQNIGNVSDDNARVEGVTAAFMMIRKSLYKKVGGLNEGYKDVFQDVDLNLRISSLGYVNYCIRKHHLIHVDHATRKTDGTPESRLDMAKFQNDWVRKGLYPVKKTPEFSVLVCATNSLQLNKLYTSITTREKYEMIYMNNKSGYQWSSEALNVLTEVSAGEYLFWMHQDVTFDAFEPFATVKDVVSKIGGKFGILGPAGIQVGGKGTIRGIDFSSRKYTFDFLRCQTVDEFCIIGMKTNGLKFGEYLDHFHFYGADICCQAIEKGLDNFVIKIPITHHSGGDVNLKKEGGYEDYLNQGRKFYKNWYKKYPFISTTTVHFRKGGRVHWFLGDLLGLTPNKEILDMDVIETTKTTKLFLKNQNK